MEQQHQSSSSIDDKSGGANVPIGRSDAKIDVQDSEGSNQETAQIEKNESAEGSSLLIKSFFGLCFEIFSRSKARHKSRPNNNKKDHRAQEPSTIKTLLKQHPPVHRLHTFLEHIQVRTYYLE